MSVAINKQLIRDYINDFNKNYQTAINRYVADNELIERINTFESAFPGGQLTIDDLFGEADKVIVRGAFHGTHKGEFLDFAATGKKAIASFIIIYRIQDGKIVEHWMNVDLFGLMQQLG